ncbi:FHA domain-containing protein, partial [Nocardia elegans]|uniref:FHA domain-containing protein n=1 Tax=Nocardia elegans TaxID=300029 RepID=UPI001894B03C
MSSPGAQTITVRHDGTERVFDSSQLVTLGRAPEVTLFVDSPLVSRVHATLTWQGSGWVLTDNGSTNGVFVDARRLTQPVSIDRPTQVRLGDAINGPLLHLLPAAPAQRPHPPQGSPPQGAPQQGTPQHRPPQRPSYQRPPTPPYQPPHAAARPGAAASGPQQAAPPPTGSAPARPT